MHCPQPAPTGCGRARSIRVVALPGIQRVKRARRLIPIPGTLAPATITPLAGIDAERVALLRVAGTWHLLCREVAAWRVHRRAMLATMTYPHSCPRSRALGCALGPSAPCRDLARTLGSYPHGIPARFHGPHYAARPSTASVWLTSNTVTTTNLGLSLSRSASVGPPLVSRPRTGAHIMSPCSPARTLRPAAFHCRNPATIVALGHWHASKHAFPTLSACPSTVATPGNVP